MVSPPFRFVLAGIYFFAKTRAGLRAREFRRTTLIQCVASAVLHHFLEQVSSIAFSDRLQARITSTN